MRLVIALLVWASATGGAIELSSAVARSVGTESNAVTVRTGRPGFGGSSAGVRVTESGGSPVNPRNVTATSRLSLFRASNLAPAIRAARRELGRDARVSVIAIYPAYMSIVAVKGAMTVNYTYTQGVAATSPGGGAMSGPALFALGRVSATAPGALVRRIASRAQVSAKHLRYIVAQVDPVSKRLQWYAYLRPGSRVTYFEASAQRDPLLELPAGGSSGLQRVGG